MTEAARILTEHDPDGLGDVAAWLVEVGFEAGTFGGLVYIVCPGEVTRYLYRREALAVLGLLCPHPYQHIHTKR